MKVITVFLSLTLVFLFASCERKHPITISDRIESLPEGPEKSEIAYGYEVFVDTPLLIGPNGTKVPGAAGNLYTCQNCHLEGGTREGGLSLLDSHGQYPQYRSREGNILTLAERINSCIRMPHVGKGLPIKSREMQALLLYIRFLGQGRRVQPVAKNTRLISIRFPKNAASPDRGKKLYKEHCASCHQHNGEGVLVQGSKKWLYPPLWGDQSYRFGSSMHRNSIFARFIKGNMPFGLAKPNKPILSDEMALDIAAYINTEAINPRPMPSKGQTLFKYIEFKPFDYPKGPYVDPFPPEQHRYGPFQPILNFYETYDKKQQSSAGDRNAP